MQKINVPIVVIIKPKNWFHKKGSKNWFHKKGSKEGNKARHTNKIVISINFFMRIPPPKIFKIISSFL